MTTQSFRCKTHAHIHTTVSEVIKKVFIQGFRTISENQCLLQILKVTMIGRRDIIKAFKDSNRYEHVRLKISVWQSLSERRSQSNSKKLWDYRQALLESNPGSTCRLEVEEGTTLSSVDELFYAKMDDLNTNGVSTASSYLVLLELVNTARRKINTADGQDYALWEVIENGNSWVPIPVTTPSETGTSTATKMTMPSTTEEKTCKKNDVKARSLLLMALPNEHQLTFDHLESLDSIFNMIQRLVSRLAILGVVTPSEDLNVKFLRSLPSEWDTHVKVKKSVGARNDDKNMAFVTTSGASSTNNINIVKPEVSTSTT
ncbi:hypothetical protein Tco_0173168 [Tanacetum coccineum]